jgi:hypothetical protein
MMLDPHRRGMLNARAQQACGSKLPNWLNLSCTSFTCETRIERLKQLKQSRCSAGTSGVQSGGKLVLLSLGCDDACAQRCDAGLNSREIVLLARV